MPLPTLTVAGGQQHEVHASAARASDRSCRYPAPRLMDVRIKKAGAVLVLLLIFRAAAIADDWPRFLGPYANGTSRETGLLDKWSKEGPPRVWSKAIGTGYSAPSVIDHDLVLHHRMADEEVVQCFDALTGKQRWRYAYASQFIDPYGYNNGPRSSPLLISNRCF